MKVIVIGMFAMTTTAFEIRRVRSLSWWELRASIRTRLAQELPASTFDRYYRCFQVYFSTPENAICQRATADVRFNEDSTVIVVPATRFLSDRYKSITGQITDENMTSNLQYANWSVRYESLKAVFGAQHDQDKGTELANLGLHGVEKIGEAALVQCCHCYGIVMISTRDSAQNIRMKHISEFPACPIKDTTETNRTTWQAETGMEPYYKQQMMSLAVNLTRLREITAKELNSAHGRIQEFKLRGREPHRNDKGGFQCALCLSERAIVIALPCLHLCMCAKCYSMTKSHNDANGVTAKCIMCNEVPEYFSRVFGDNMDQRRLDN